MMHIRISPGVGSMARRPVALIISIVLLVIAWLLLTTSIHYQELIAGMIVAIAVSLALVSMLPEGGKKNPVTAVFRFIIFSLVLAKEMIIANLDVAYRVLHPKMPIRPGIVEVRPRIRSEMGKLLLSNSITLTPGTLSMDWIDDKLYIHWINVDEKHKKKAMEPLDSSVKEVFP